MQLSLNWLRTYVDLPESLEELEALLTNVGLEVESIEDRRDSFKDIVVGEVLTCEKHPNADKLSVCTVSNGADVSTVVCGAPNVAAGQKVIFAQVGAHIEKLGFTIDRRKLRGIESAGMICSSSELGLDDDHSGIAVLQPGALPGTPIARYLGFDDVILGIGITPNRGDALSHIGTARDIAAATAGELRVPTPELAECPDPEPFSIDIRDPELCPRYSGAIVRDVTVTDSPDWLRKALTAAGVRPINNVVDVTNYVMMEIGQPMHAFDLELLEGSSIVVRAAEPGETITTLDDEERRLPERALLICDAVKPVAVAGVMGGQHSAVSTSTTSILLESAHFNPSSVRRTAKMLQLSTDSSYRFERGSDPNVTLWALRRAVQLILETAGGKLRGLYDAYPSPVLEKIVALRPAFVNRILGIEISASEQRRILEALQVRILGEDDAAFQCSIPTFRSDIEREIDLVEEIARIHGYDNIPVPTRIEMNVGTRFDDQAFPARLRNLVLGFGFDEILSSSLVSRGRAGVSGEGGTVVDVLNPVSKERPSLRTSLLPSILEAIDLNIRNGMPSVRIAEIGHVFAAMEEKNFTERNMLAFAITGNAQERSWYAPGRESDFFDLKGVLHQLVEALYIDNDTIFYYDRTSTLSEHVLTLEVKGRYAGQAVEVSDAILASFDIGQPVYYAELDIDLLCEALPKRQRYVSVAKYPSMTRDLAVLVAKDILAEQITRTVQLGNPAYLKSVRVVDVFTHGSIGKDRKSVAFTMTFQADERTLTDEDINDSVDAIVSALKRELQAELRA
ncbi:MAG: phenylalanine--tRNA ligase subunit beta [Bacteroidetes bacterium]|nr:phenylalanine--tRNA ligase subunit beta [Bacteroidota bacterium]